ncbi:isoamyl alcohol oxidase [Penicillium cinerascens]|uniref:Isoamyl alcohol oxidase n=1 Tax=Penicillium cinerascens TaxID=70096 RepID=A0A9W9TAH2_9EURO|nr:isoamyl alcohol oxidase [Penicillium cinerascens]KAJ5215361.1 isoamyl alcohol oxidase [Penicillium cinerascens]
MVSYAVNVSSPAEISRTMTYAAEKNLRLVIRNTGHDYMGKSTGTGGLSIWTHHLKEIKVIPNYSSPHYSGPAVTIGAGAQGEEVYAALHKHNLVMVGGECATVGLAGGYTQGGGHSALSSRFGLAADQTLEWELVDGKGRQLHASPTDNADLYWALSGGGGGTYGVVTSLTVKVFPDFSVAGVVLEFESDPSNLDPFYDAVEYYHSLVPAFTAAGGMAIARVMNSSFLLTPLTLPSTNEKRALELITPLINKLDQLNISYVMKLTHFPSYMDHYNALIEPNPTQLVDNGQYGGKLIPLSVIEQSNSALTAAMRNITQDGVTFVSIGLNVSSTVMGATTNSVLPSWRTAAMNVILATSWPEHANLGRMNQLANDMTHKWMPMLSSLTSDPGCYMNEADPQQPNWQEAFYGPNYNRLLAIKKKYDPDDSFYAHTAVGSEKWVQESDGRLCRATSS